MSNKHFRLTPAGVMASVALFFALGGVAFATSGGFVGSGGKIQGCVGKGGALSVVEAGKSCPKHTTSLPFSQTGKQGVPGKPGEQGQPGEQGDPGQSGAGTQFSASVTGVASSATDFGPASGSAAGTGGFGTLATGTSTVGMTAEDLNVNIGHDTSGVVVSLEYAPVGGSLVTALTCTTNSSGVCTSGSSSTAIPAGDLVGVEVANTADGSINADVGWFGADGGTQFSASVTGVASSATDFGPASGSAAGTGGFGTLATGTSTVGMTAEDLNVNIGHDTSGVVVSLEYAPVGGSLVTALTCTTNSSGVCTSGSSSTAIPAGDLVGVEVANVGDGSVNADVGWVGVTAG